MSSYYQKKGHHQQDGGVNQTQNFDLGLNVHTWVDFILKLRNTDAISFGVSYEAIKYESTIEFWYPRPPVMTFKQQQSWKQTFEYDIYKRQMTNILNQAGKYDESCNKACETLLSSKYMSDEVRARVVDHPLFNKVLLNQLPTEE